MLAKSSIEMGLASKPIDTNQDHHKARKQERAKVEDRSASRNLSQEDDNHRESLQQRFAMLTAMLQAMLLALWEVPVATLRAVLCANAVTKAVEEVCQISMHNKNPASPTFFWIPSNDFNKKRVIKDLVVKDKVTIQVAVVQWSKNPAALMW